MAIEEAFRLAEERHLDLIQVTEKVEPPVCRLGDLGKYLYWQEKKQKDQGRQKQKGGRVKGIRLSFAISDHDLNLRIKRAKTFLEQGNKVLLEMRLRGREKALHGFARGKTDKFLESLNQLIPIKVEGGLKKGPRGFALIITKN